MLYCYANNQFPEDYMPTVFDNYNANTLFGNKTVSLGLWDTAGQEDYDELRPLSYPETHVFLACFSVISKTSLTNIRDKWIPEIRKHLKETPILLVGLKKDLRNDPKTQKILQEQGESIVSEEEGKEVSLFTGCITYCECSAKTREGLEEVFTNAIASVLDPDRFKIRPSSKDARTKDVKCCLLM
ncbi:hypothetical protein ABK040_009550 [Willaertia magna]